MIWPELAPLSSLDAGLVVVGDRDKSDFIAIAQHLASEIDGAEFAVVPGAGHLVGSSGPGAERTAARLPGGLPPRCRRLAQHGVRESRGQASFAQSPNARSVRHASASPAVGIDPEERAAAAEVAERARRVARARPVRRLARPAARSRAPSRSASAARSPGSTPSSPGNWTAAASSSVSARDRAAARAARARRERDRRAGRRRPSPAEPASWKPPSHTCAKYVGERHLGPLGDESAEHLETRVRVDAPLPGLRDRRACLERQPRRVREQVPHRRAGRAGRLVEIDDALLDGDEHGDRGCELRHRRPGERCPTSPNVASTRPVTDRDVVALPHVDLAQSLHDVDTTAVDRQLSRPARPSSSASAIRARCASATGLGLRHGADHAGDADPPTGAYEQARVCLAIIARALGEAGASLDDVVRTRIYVTDAGSSTRSAAPTARPSQPPGRRRPASSRELLDPRWLVEIEAEAVILTA